MKTKSGTSAIDFTEQFYAITEIELSESGGRYTSSLQVLPEGKFVHPWYGDLDFTAPVLRAAKRNFDKKVLGTDIMVDEGHDRGRALGWFKELSVGKRTIGETEYSGLFAEIEWTDLGRSLLEGKIYRYFSAEFGNWTGPTGEKAKNVLLGGGLTNRPYFKQMSEVQFAEGQVTDRFVIGLFGDDNWSFETPAVAQGERTFNSGFHDEEEEEDVAMDELIKSINIKYSKNFTTTDEVMAFMGEVGVAPLERMRTTFSALGLEFSADSDPIAVVAKAFKTAKDENVSMGNRLTTVEKSLSDAEFERLFSEQLRAGKVVPAQKESMKKLFSNDAALFSELMESQPATVQLGEQGSAPTDEPGNSDASRFREGASETQDEVKRYVSMAGGKKGN